MGWRVGSGRGWGRRFSCSDKIMPMEISDLEALATVIKPIAKQIELLSQRINTNRSTWQGNEMATRLQLIDPMLREIGWDTADPDQVRPEYSVGSRNADYVLLSGSCPIAVVEAKNLGVKIDSGSRLQALSYVDSASIKFVVVTNGDRWELYSSSLSDTKALGAFTISRDAPYLAAIEAAKISRSVLVDTSKDPAIDPKERKKANDNQPRNPEPNRGWTMLSQLEYQVGKRRPNLMLLPDGEQISLTSWKNLWIEIAEWVTTNHDIDHELSFGHLPNMAIRSQNARFWKGFGQQLRSGYWVAGGDINAQNSIEYARALLKQIGEDIDNVRFRFD